MGTSPHGIQTMSSDIQRSVEWLRLLVVGQPAVAEFGDVDRLEVERDAAALQLGVGLGRDLSRCCQIRPRPRPPAPSVLVITQAPGAAAQMGFDFSDAEAGATRSSGTCGGCLGEFSRYETPQKRHIPGNRDRPEKTNAHRLSN